MTRTEQQQRNPAYRDWRAAYVDDVCERVKHWGDARASGRRLYRDEEDGNAGGARILRLAEAQ